VENPVHEIMTIEDVADYLRIPLSSAYKLAQEGKIPGQKVGRHWRFHRRVVETWIMRTSAEPQIETAAAAPKTPLIQGIS